jgi:N-acetylglucosaminyldiphosphoundecaprenol N-acetyl-beta-D-mannosaminyltransferase
LAANARQYVVERHSHLRAAASYVELYRRALHAGGGVETDTLAGAQPDRLPPPPWPSISVLGFPVDIVSLEQAAGWAVGVATQSDWSGRTALAVSFNPEIVMQAQEDPAVAQVLWEADLSYPDGVGATWAAGRQGARGAPGETGPAGTPERVPGIDLAERLVELAAENGLAVYLLGAAPGVADEAAERQRTRFPGLKVVGTHDGYFSSADEEAVVCSINAAAPAILLVAMGAPRQELFLYRNRERLGARVALGVGGSFDVWAGRVKRAPEWTQRAKVEWLYRLASDPRRLRRQLVLPRYALKVLRWSPDDYGPPRRRRPPDMSRGEGGGA